MKENEATTTRDTSDRNPQPAESETTGDSLLLYFVGCGIFWRREGRSETLRELMTGLHHVDPLIGCVASQMLALNSYNWVAA